MEYLKKLISFCKENDIEFVAVTTPIPINTLKDYSDNYNAAWKYFGQFFEEQSVEYLNFNTQYFKAFTHDLKAYTDYDLSLIHIEMCIRDRYKDREKSGGIL